MRTSGLEIHEMSSEELAKYNELLDDMAIMLCYEWSEDIKNMQHKIDTATSKYECHRCFYQMILLKEMEINEQFDRLPLVKVVRIISIIDLSAEI